MLSRPPRRLISLSFNGPKLVLCIAAGVWLGMTASSLTTWLAHRTPLGASAPASVVTDGGQVLRSPPSTTNAPELTPGTTVPPANDSEVMFDQYQKNLRAQQLQQIEQAARANPGNLSNAKCQFWLEQVQTAPSDKSRENVAQFCK